MERLKFEFEVITPMFLGGASPNGEAELRPPSIKGMLRWWFRTLGGSWEDEERIFGSSGDGRGKALFRLHIPNDIKGNWVFDRRKYSHYEKPGKCPDKKVKINGIVYAGYSLTLGSNNRKGIPNGTNFNLLVSFRPSTGYKEKKLIAGLLWILGTLGGLGTRWRRGFGSIQIKQNNIFKPIEANSPDKWLSQFSETKDNIFNAIKPYSGQASIWKMQKIFVWEKTFATWDQALNEVASKMQEFRQCRNPDHDNVLRMLKFNRHLREAPQRTVFGMPLTFRFKNVKKSAQFKPEHHERMASPVIFHITKLRNKKFLPIVLIMEGPFLERRERITIKESRATIAKPGSYIDGQRDDTLITDFIKDVLKPNALEVSL